MSMSTFNRKNKYKEHYINKIGEGNSMTYPIWNNYQILILLFQIINFIIMTDIDDFDN